MFWNVEFKSFFYLSVHHVKGFDGKADEERSEDAFFFGGTTCDKFVNSDHLDSVSGFDSINQIILEHDWNRHGQQSRRGHFGKFLNDNHLGVLKSRRSVKELKWISVIIFGLDGSTHCNFIFFFRVKRIGVFSLVEGVGDLAVVLALLKVILTDVHFGDNSLEADEFVAHSAVESSGSDKVGTEVALDLDVISLGLGGDFFLQILTLVLSLKVLLDEDVVLGGVLDDLLGGLGVEGPVGVDIECVVFVVRDGLPGQVIGEQSLILVLSVLVLDLHLGAFYKYYNLL